MSWLLDSGDPLAAAHQFHERRAPDTTPSAEISRQRLAWRATLVGVVVPDTGARPLSTSHDHEPARRELAHRLVRSLTAPPDELDDVVAEMRTLRHDFTRLQMHYQFGIDEVLTKVTILRREFESGHAHSPIEHVRSRLKSIDSLVAKMTRIGCEPTIPAVRERIRDIAGIRIVCSFVSDVYWIASRLQRQPDLTVLETEDYIRDPKPNGYRSLHLSVEVPVFLSEHTEHIPIELQIRTIGMDFWASIEHKLSYKYDGELPDHITAELDAAARTAAELDEKMGLLRDELDGAITDAAARGGPQSRR